jgi:hypothetical protein
VTYQNRSLDDMPLAAYSTGVTDEGDDEAVPEPPRLTQQDAMALIMGVEAGGATAAETTPVAGPGR